MNLYGSYRALLGNSVSAMLASIEIYNKPQFLYRSECFIILLLNSWELALKAHLSKNRIRIYKAKEVGKDYQTLQIFAALREARASFPTVISYAALKGNLQLLVKYRNNAIHFYNAKGFDAVVYSIAQTAIINYRNFVEASFGRNASSEVNINLLPLSFSCPIDPIVFIGATPGSRDYNSAVSDFLGYLAQKTSELEQNRQDTGQLLTIFNLSLNSVKKIEGADFVVGVEAANPATPNATGTGRAGNPLLVTRRVDPNTSHPLRQKDILEQIGNNLKGVIFNSRTFHAIVKKYNIKDNDALHWKSNSTSTSQYSREVLAIIRRLSKVELETARAELSQR